MHIFVSNGLLRR